MKSKFLNINQNDFVKGLIVTMLTALLYPIISYLDSGVIPNMAQIKPILLVSITAGLSYILKNLVSNSHDKILQKEPKKASE